jgi:hypothetical protein
MVVNQFSGIVNWLHPPGRNMRGIRRGGTRASSRKQVQWCNYPATMNHAGNNFSYFVQQ